jgi:uncharacterized protein (DUF697 family)
VGFRETVDRIRKSDFGQASTEQRDKSSKEVITVCSLASGGLVLQPIPALEQGVILVQVGMVIALAHIHNEQLDRKRAKEVLMDLGAVTGVNLLGRQAATTIAKVLLPGIGGVLAAPSAFAITWATGHAAQHYFASGGKLDKEKLKAIFEQEKKRGRAHYSDDAARDARPDAKELDGDA